MDYNDKRIFRKGLLTGLIIALFISALLITGIFVFVYRSSAVLTPRVKAKVSYLTNYIQEKYYEDVDINKLQEGLYKGLVEGLGDEYSTYLSAEEADSFKSYVTGELCGLGAVLTKEDSGDVVVLKVYEGSAADEIGLRGGDIIVAADDKMASDMELSDFTSYTKGGENTSFNLTYRRGDDTRQTKVTRKKIKVPSVSHKMLDGNIGYIEILEFSKNTYSEYMDAINDLKANGVKGVIFDLRFNGGGLVESSAQILDEILPKAKIVSLQIKNQPDVTYDSDDEKKLDMPIAVLVSNRTASASEIFAAAIKDNNYGTLIGYKTYGKGVVQASSVLEDGSVISITSGKYFTPSGECINEKGIEPDIKLDFEYKGDSNSSYDEMMDNQVLKAIEVINSKL